MKIIGYELNITRESVASYYELKIRHEERQAFVMIGLVTFAIFFALPILLTRIILDLGNPGKYGLMMDALIIESLVIAALALLLTSNAYRAGKLFKRLRKNKNLEKMLQYVHDTDQDNAPIHTAWILHFKQYMDAYITEDEKLVILYQDDGRQEIYETYDYVRLCKNDAQNTCLCVNADKIRIIDAENI